MTQRKNRTEERKPMRPTPIKINSIEAAKLALPFYGGTSPEEPEPTETETTVTTKSAEPSTTTGGDKAELTPEKMQEIIKQNEQLAEQTKTLATQLEGYTKKEADAEKAKLGEIERRDKELEEQAQTIVAMDRVVRETAVINAINSNPDLKFHSARHVIAELDPEAYDIDVDLKNGTATVQNLEKELKRVAEKNPWMVVTAAQNPGNGNAKNAGNPNPGASKRGSGNPPNPGAGRTADATQRRSDLIKKFPVLASRGTKA